MRLLCVFCAGILLLCGAAATQEPGPSPAQADALHKKAMALAKQNKYREALPLFEQALAIRRALPATSAADLARGVMAVAIAHYQLGRPEKARGFLEEALAIRRKTPGTDDPTLDKCLNNLGVICFDLGRFEQARRLHDEALTLRRKTLPAGHPDVAVSLNNLGNALTQLGQPEKALRLHEEALALRRQMKPARPLDVAQSLVNLGNACHVLGRLEKARRHVEEALILFRKEMPAGHPMIAQVRHNLACVYQELGQYERARELYEEALAVYRNLKPAPPTLLAGSLNNLGNVFLATGQAERGHALHEEALALRRKALPAGHPDVAQSLSNLGWALSQLGRPKEARDRLEEALAVMRKARPEGHPDLAVILNNLSTVADNLDDLEQARRLQEEALAVRRKALPAEHPLTAGSLNNLAWLLFRMGRRDAAWKHAAEASVLLTAYQRRILLGTAGSEHAPFLAQARGELDTLLRLAEQTPDLSADRRRELLDLVLDRKALAGATGRLRQEAALLGKDAEAGKLFAELKRHRQQLADLLLRGPLNNDFAAYRQQTAELRRRQDRLEEALAERVRPYAEFRAREKSDSWRLAAALADGEVLVEFCAYQGWDAKARRDVPRYLALLLGRDPRGQAQTRLVLLGDARPIEQALHAWRAAVQRGGVDGAIEQELRRRVWDPLAAALPPSAGRLTVAPDGELSLLPFAAVRLPDGAYLVEKLSVRYVTSGRDLLPAAAGKDPSQVAVVVSDPAFDAGAAAAPSKGEQLRSTAFPEKGLHFTRLPGFRREAEAVGELLKARPGWDVQHRKETLASEEALAQIRRPRLLYCVTHGFFLPGYDRLPGAKGPARDLELFDLGGPARPKTLDPSRDPRLLSGLALAGANRWRERSAKGLSDGLLTALEVENLDLWGTELVVLSACDTGRGEVRVGEGVVGLRNAFQQAGAQTVIASLWKVPDAETEKLMTSFLGRWLKGAGKAEALRQAQLELIRELRRGGDAALRQAPPLYWAGFVCHGRAD